MCFHVFIPKEAISAIELTGKFKEHTHNRLTAFGPGQPG